MKKLFSICLISLILSGSIFAQTLSKGMISSDSLCDLISDDFEIYQYDDGDIRVTYKDYKIFINFDSKRNLLKFDSYWPASENISENRAYKLCNTWNRDKVFTTAYFDMDEEEEERYFALEYFLTTYGGINADTLNDSLDWIFNIADGFGDYLSEEDALD